MVQLQSGMASTLAQADYIYPGLQNPSEGSAASALEKFLVSNNLQSVILMDGLGYVRIRAEQRYRTGDNLYPVLPWLAPVFTGAKVNGVAFSEYNLPALVSAAPVLKDNTVIGAVMLTTTLNEAWAQKNLVSGVSLGVINQNGLTAFITNDSAEKLLYQSGDLRDQLRLSVESYAKLSLKDQLKPNERQFQIGLNLNRGQYLLTGQYLDSLVPSLPAGIVTLTESAHQPEWPSFLKVFLGLLVVILAAAVWLIRIQILRTRRDHV